MLGSTALSVRRAVLSALLVVAPLVPLRSQSVEGRVVNASLGIPVGQAIVELMDSSGRVSAHSTTGSNGQFILRPPRPDTYLLQIRAIEFRPLPGQLVSVPMEKLLLGDIPLRPVTSRSLFSDTRPGGLPEIVVHGRHLVEKVSHLHRLWDPVSGRPVALVEFAIISGSLMIDPRDSIRRAIVDLGVSQRNEDTHLTRDTSVRVVVALADTVRDADRHIGYFITASDESILSWTMIATQPFRRSGSDWEPKLEPIGRGQLRLSDLVVGDSAHGLVADLRGHAVMLAPLDSIDRHDRVRLFYQVKSSGPVVSVRRRLSLRHADLVGGDSAPLRQIETPDTVGVGVHEVNEELDVSALPAGFFEIAVEILDDHGKTITRQRTFFEIR